MPKRPPQAPSNFTNQKLTDRELLANIKDAEEADGWATTTEIAIACGYTGNGSKNKTPATKVASRLAWMRDGGLLESTLPDYTVSASEPGARDTRWRLTEAGELIRTGQLSKAVENAIARMDPGAMILMMRRLTQLGYIDGDVPVAFALRREYQHRIAQRRLKIR